MFSAFLTFFYDYGFWLGIINISFLIGMGLLVIGGLMKVVESGFFNGIQYAFKRFRKSTKEGSYISKFDDMDETKDVHEEYNKQKSFALTAPFLLSGSIAVAADLIASYLFYT
ncbi:tryptophanyl-tRNA synthetase [Bacillus sp. SG-1]|nr:tryptophanyl-tRNA synthetase [Bacillus sp. SG-1]